MTPILHQIPASRSFRTLWLLHEMGITPELRTYSITDGSLRTPEYLGLSPAGRIPALEIDGLTIYESGAISEYLCATRPEHGLGRAVGDADYVPFLEAMHYAETAGSLIENLNLQWLFLRDPAQRSDTVAKLHARRLASTLKPLETRLSGQDHILASGFSAADTMMSFSIAAARRYVRFDAFPNLSAYSDRMAERPAYKAARAQEGPSAFGGEDFYEVTG